MTTERTLFDRLLSAQKKIGVIAKDKVNPYFDSKYTDINALIEMVKPILNEEGLLILQPLSNVNGRPAITTIIMHGTERIESTFTIPDIDNPQKVGGAVTYGRRYMLMSLLCMEAEDDDGNAASQPSAPKKDKPKEQSKQAGSSKEIPTCSICHQPMKPQANNPDKFYCKHTGETGATRWGNPIHSKQKVI
jgi:hypothetical protein